MELKPFELVTNPEQLEQLEQLLIQADRESIPPLSARRTTTQAYLAVAETNASHLNVLEKLGFRELCRLKNHRGEGMDTVYFERRSG